MLSPSSVSENGGVSTVTAALSHPSSEAVTVTVATTPVAPAGTWDFTQSGTTLTIAAGSTASAGAVTITGRDDAADAADAEVSVAGTAAGGNGVADPRPATLTLEDDDRPAATLVLTPSSIPEGGFSTVTARLSGAARAAVTITVATAPGANTASRDFTTSDERTLTIAAGTAASAGVVTIVGRADSRDSPDKTVTVTGTGASAGGAVDVTGAALTVTDDDPTPTATLIFTRSGQQSPITSISENGGVATVSARLSGGSSGEAITITVSATAGTNAAAGDFTLSSAKTLTIAAGDTASAGAVTLSAVNDETDSPDKTVTVSGAVSGGWGLVADPASADLDVQDDDPTPSAGLILSPFSISENGEVSTVTAKLSRPSTEAAILTVSASPGANAVAGDFALSAAKTLTVAAGETTSAGVVTVRAVDNDVHAPAVKRVTLSATVAGGRGATLSSSSDLQIREDDAIPTVTLLLSPPSILENAGVSSVTAALSRPSSEAVTVTVTAAPAAGTETVAGDFTRSAANTLTIAAGDTASVGDVTVTAVDNAADTVSRQVTVSGTASGGNGVLANPADVELAIVDDDGGSVVALSLSPSSISETGGVATVTAVLSPVMNDPVTVTVTTAPGTGADAGDFALGAATTLTFASATGTSAGVVVVSAVGDAVDEPDQAVTVSGTAASRGDVSDPRPVTLTVVDDDNPPVVSISSPSVTEGAAGATATLSFEVTLDAASGRQVVANWTERTDLGGTATAGTDYVAPAGGRLTFAPGETSKTVPVTVTGDGVHEPDETVKLGVTPLSTLRLTLGTAAVGTGTIVDDETLPTAALKLAPASISENGGVSTVTATLSGKSSAAVTLTVAAAPGTGAAGGDFALSAADTLTIAAGTTASVGAVTVTAADDDADSPDKSVTVSATAAGGNGVAAPAEATLTLTDDEAAPTVTLALSRTSIEEDPNAAASERRAAVTATLSGKSSAAVTITVSAAADANAAADDFALSSAATLTFAAGSTTSAGAVTVAAADDDVDSVVDTSVAGKRVAVSGTAAGGGIADPAGVLHLLIVEDDDAGLTVDPAFPTDPARPWFVVDEGDDAAFTVRLDSEPTEDVTVAVASTDAAQGSVSPESLTFTAANWSTAQTVTLTGVEDHVVDGDGDYRVTLDPDAAGDGTDAYDGVATIGAPVKTTNADVAGIVASASAVTVTEGGAGAAFTVKLASKPKADVTVTATSADAGDAQVATGAGAALRFAGAQTLTFTAGDWSTAQTVTVRAVDDAVDEADGEPVAITLDPASTGDGLYDGLADATVTATVIDDDAAPTAALALSAASISESGGVATVTATLSGPSSAAVILTVSAAAVSSSDAEDADFALSAATTLTIAAGSTASAGAVTVTAVDNDAHAPDEDRKVAVSAAVAGGRGVVAAPADATLTLTDDETLPEAALALSMNPISENGGIATVTATLSGKSDEAVTITVAAAAGTNADADDFALSAARTLTIAAGTTASAGTVTIVATDDATAGPGKQVTVSGTAAGGNGVEAPNDVTLTLTDDDGVPQVVLALSPAAIDESGAGNVATVTATLSEAARAAVTVTVSAAAVAASGAEDADFALSPARTLVVAAGSTVSAGTVTIAAADNDVDAPDKRVKVSGTAASDRTIAQPVDVTLTIADDDPTPAATLALEPSSISEAGGVSTVTATLSGASSAATTITVSAAAVAASGAVADDFMLSSATTLTIAAGDTASAGVVTVTAKDNDVDSPDKRVKVSGAASNSHGVAAPSEETLAVTDDDDPPTVTLALSRTVIEEDSNAAADQRSATVTAALNHPSHAAVTVTVSAAAGANAAADDFALSVNRTLVVAAGRTASVGAVTITAVDDAIDSTVADNTARKRVIVSGASSGAADPAVGVAHPADAALAIVEDDDAGLTLDPALPANASDPWLTVAEGGTAAFTVKLATEPTGNVTVKAASGDTDEGTLSSGAGTPAASTTLTFTASNWNAAQTVTLTGVIDDTVDGDVDYDLTLDPDGESADAYRNAATVAAKARTTNVDAAGLALSRTAVTVAEGGAGESFTVALAKRPLADVTVTVKTEKNEDAGQVEVAAGGGSSFAASQTLTFTNGDWSAAQTVTVKAVDDAVDEPDGDVPLALVTESAGAPPYEALAPVTVTARVNDDDATPTATLALSPSAISEDGGVSTVTATLSGAASDPVTVTVSAAPGAGTDFTLSAAKTLTIAAGSTASAGDVTITAANRDTTATANRSVTVSGAAAGDNRVPNPSDVTLTIFDDDGDPKVSLVSSSSSISESGGVATVTAVLNRAVPGAAVTVTVSAAAGTGAADGDFSLSNPATLTIAAGATASTGAVTVTAVDNDVDSPNKQVEVSGQAASSATVSGPDAVTLALADDDPTPAATLALSPASISESGGVATVTATLSGVSSEAVTLTVAAAPGAGAAGTDFALSAAKTLTIAAGSTASAGAVTVTANGNGVDSPDKSVTVSATAAGGNGVADPRGATLTLADDDPTPTVTLALSDSSIAENGGVSTVTATLSGESSAAVTVTVSAAPAGVVTPSPNRALVIAAGATASTGLVTMTAVDNGAVAPAREVTVSGASAGGNGVADPADVTLTVTDDDTPRVTLALSSSSISEGGVSTVTATLDKTSTAAVTVTVSASAGADTDGADFTLSAANTLTVAAGSTASAGAVTVTAAQDALDEAAGAVTVTGRVDSSVREISDPAAVTLAIADDDAPPALSISSPTVTEGSAGESATTALSFQVTLSAASGREVKVNFADVVTGSGAGTASAGNDYTTLSSGALMLSIARGATAATTGMLTFAAGETAKPLDAAVVADKINEPDETVKLTLSGAVNATLATATGTGTITDDDDPPTLGFQHTALRETEGDTRSQQPASACAVISQSTGYGPIGAKVSTSDGTASAGTDYNAIVSQDIGFPHAPGGLARSTERQCFSVSWRGDEVDEHDETFVVTLHNLTGRATLTPNRTATTLTIVDDDPAPTLSLALSDPISGQPNTIKELAAAPSAERMATVTASLSAASGAAVTVTVQAAPGTNAAADDFTLSANTKLTIAAGATASTGVVTITAVDDDVDSIVDSAVAGKKVTLSASVTGTASQMAAATDSQGNPTAVAELLIWEDDRAALVTDPAFPRCRRAPCPVWLSVDEGAGETFTVKLNSEPTTNVTVAVKSSDSGEGLVSSGAGAAAASTRLTFTPANWETAQTVTLHGVADDVVDGDGDYTIRLFPDTPDEATDAYHVIGGASVRPQTVRTTNVDAAGLVLSKTAVTVTEGGAGEAFTVRLTSKPAGAVTVTAASGAADEARLSVGVGPTDGSKDLVFTPDDWRQPRQLTVMAVDDTVDEADGEEVVITLDPKSADDADYGAAGLANGTVTATVNDNDDAPTVTLAASPSSISENGGEATVTATLSGVSAEPTTVTVTGVSGFYAAGSDATIVIPAGQTANAADTATVDAVDDDVHQGAAGRSTTVTATVGNGVGAGAVTGAALALTDDEAAPGATLSLSDASISENGGTSAVSATLSRASAAATTVTVTAVAGAYTVGSDATIVIAAGDTTAASDTATIAAVDNATDEANRTATVTGTLANDRGAGAVTGAELTLEDDDAAPTPIMSISPPSSPISENGGTATVSLTLSHPSSAATTLTVAASAGVYTVASGAGASIVIAAGETANASDTAVITAVDNDVDADTRTASLRATLVNDQGLSLTSLSVGIEFSDDDTAGVSVAPATSTSSRLQTTEAGGRATFTVTLDTEPTGDVVLDIASSDTAEGVVSPSSLTFTATTWSTAQTVTLTGVNDSPGVADGSQDYAVTLTVNQTGTADANYDALSAVTVYAANRDDDLGLDVGAVTGQATEAGGTATFTVALLTQPSAAVTVTVTSRDTGEGLVSAGGGAPASSTTLTFTAGSSGTWNVDQTVTVTGQDDDVHDGAVAWTVRLDPASGDSDYNGLANEDVSVTTTDDENPPDVTLSLSPSSISENGGEATVTATLSGVSAEPTTVTVTGVSGFYAAGSDATIVIAAGQTANAADTATVDAVDDDVHQGAAGRSTTVTATVGNGVGAGAVTGAALALTDDEAAPGATLSLSDASISENGGTSAVSAALSRASAAATTVTVTAVAGAYTVGSDATIVIAAGDTTAASDTATIAAVDNATDEANRTATVTGVLANDRGAGAVTGAELTLEDDDAAPTATLSVAAPSISEDGGTTAVSATLNRPSSAATTVTVTAVAGAYTVASGAGAAIVIAAGQTANALDTATINAVDNDVDAVDNMVTVAGAATNDQAAADTETVSVTGASLTITDDDAAGFAVSPATSSTSRLRTTESGDRATFTVALESEPTGNVVLDVASSDTAQGAVSLSSLVFTALNWSAAQTVTLSGVDDSPGAADGSQTYEVTLTVNQTSTADANYDALSAVTVYAVNADDEFGLDVGTVTGQATEAGGQATFPVKLLTQPTEAVTVSVSSLDSGEGRASPSSLTFGTTNWSVNQTVTVTGLNDDVDDGVVTWNVRLDPASGDADYNALANVDVSVTTTDDDGPPAVTLSLSPSSIDESGTANTAAVRATLSRASGAATTVTVTAVSGFYTVGSDATVVIAAGNTAAASDTAAIAAVDNDVDEPDRTPTVTATVANDRAAADSTTMAVTGAALTIRDDDAAPNATLSLNPATVAENGGTSAVSATLSRASSAATTVTVTAVSGFYTVGSDATIVIAAGATAAASDTATIAAVDNDVDEPDRTATVTAALGNGQGVGSVTGATLTLTDDETLPTATLVLNPASISEAGGVSTVTARLSGKSSAAVTLTVSAAAGTGAVSGDFSQTGTTLTIAAGATASAGRVTVTANDNMAATGSKQVTVSATAAGGNGVANPANAALTLTDDDAPQVTLALSSSSIGENGGAATVTATLDRISAVAVTVTAAAAPVSPAVATDFTLSSANTLTFAANATTSSGVVTITAANNDTDAPNKSVTVSGASSDSLGLANNPSPVTLTITDDDAAPGATLSLSDASIAENGGTSVVSAALSHPSSAATTVTVTAVSGSFTVPSGAAGYVVIAAGDTTAASDTVTITAVNNDVDEPNRMATVAAAVTNDQGAGSVTAVTLTLEDDDATPTAALSVNPGSIPENGGTAAVSATLSGRSSQPTTVTVTAQANVYTVAPGAGGTIVIAAGATTTTDTATVTAVDNDVDAADNAATVTGTAANGHGVTAAATGASLTITDDDAAGIVMDPATTTASRVRTSEDGSQATVDVTLASEPTGDVRINVASLNAGEGAASPSSLTFTSTNWNTAQTVTLTGVDDSPGAPDGSQNYTVTLTVDTANTADANYDALSAATIYAVNADDELGLDVGAVMGQATEAGGAATFTVRLVTDPALAAASSQSVTVTVSSRDTGEGAVSPSSLTFTAGSSGNWNVNQTVTATGVDDDVDDGAVTWDVRLDTSSAGNSDYDGVPDVDVSVTTTDDDDAPDVTLALSPASISENGGTATVRATLNRASDEATTVTVTAVSGFYTPGSDATIVIAAGDTTSADTATITAVDDAIHQGAAGRTTTVTATVANDRAAADSTTMDVTGAALTLNDDDAAPNVTLSLSDASIAENGGTSVVSATLSRASSAATTVTVTAVSGAFTVPSGAAGAIVIAAGDTTAASDTVTITAVNNDVDEPDRPATVTATAANDRGAGSVTGAALTLEDDDDAPTAALSLASSSISEDGGTTAVSATLSHRSSAATTVTVTAQANAYTVASGAGATIVIAAGATTSSDTATIMAVDNDVDAADNEVTVTATAANDQASAESQTVTVTGVTLRLTDDDAAGIVVAPATSSTNRLRTTEAGVQGGQATFTVKLASEPTGNVALDVASSDTGEATVSSSSLTFTASTWNTAQTVTLTGVDDSPTPSDPNPAAGSRPYTVTLTVNQGSTADDNYDGLPAVTVHAVNADDEYGLALAPTNGVTGRVTEGGGTATFTVALQTRPSAAVTVTMTSRDEDGNPDASEGAASPSSLVFDAGNWSRAQRVRVTGVDDDVDDGDVVWKLRLDTSSGGDANYNALANVDVAVTTIDDDAAPTVTLALEPASVSEKGGVSTVTARLSHFSIEPTTVTVAASAAGDYTLSADTMLTIAAGRIASEGTVTVTAVDDDVDNAENRSAVVTGTARNAMGVGAVTGATLTIEDDDVAGFAFAREEDRGFGRSRMLDVTEGGSTTYAVALASEPTGPVTVRIESGNVDVTPDPSSLTFTAANWNTAQAVTVTAAEDEDELADTGSLTHAGSGGGYAGVTGAVSTLVSGDVRIRVEEGTNPYRIEGRLVTVTAEAGAPSGIEVDLEGAASGPPLTLTFGPPADDVPMESDRHSLGSEASWRTVVDIEAEGAVPDSGIGVCLPVTPGLRDAAQGRPLLLLHYDGETWTAFADSSESGGRVCASGVASFSPFAAGYADTKPAFPADFAMTALVFTVDEAIDPPVPLPAATGGDGTLRYELSPALPPGIERDDDRRLFGTPTEASERRPYTWTAADMDGSSQQATLTFTIEVKPALEEARARLAAVNRSILPELSRATWGSAVEAVAGRLESPAPGAGLADAAAAALKAQEGAQDDGEGVSWRDLVTGRTFAVGLGAGGGGEGAGGGFGFRDAVMWGAGSRRSLSLEKAALGWSGDLFSAHMGVDAPLGESLRGGLAASWFESAIEYTDRSGEAAVSGVHESRMAAVHPYLGWTGPDGSRLWGTLGYGAGEIEITDAEVLDRFGVQKGDSAFMGAAAGGSVPVLSAGGVTLALKGSGEATRYSVDDNGSALAAVAVATHRLRLTAEGSRAYALPGGGTLTPSLEAGGRWDGGDGETGAGVELGGGLEWTLPSRGLAVEARGRTLAAHAGDVEEWGASGAARLSPGPGGRGLSFELSPSWGAAGSGLSRLWEEGVAGRGSSSSDDGGDDAGAARLETELGYGIGFWSGAGVATPYAGFGYEENGGRRYRLGTRFELGPRLAVGLEAERKEGAIHPEHGVKLDLRIRW